MRKFSVRWWSGDDLTEWKCAHPNHYPYHFFQWPLYFGPEYSVEAEERTGFPIGETGWMSPHAAVIKLATSPIPITTEPFVWSNGKNI